MIVTCCGHRIIPRENEIREQLKETFRDILKKNPNAIFYLGDYGQFDGLCNRVLKELQQEEFPSLQRIFVTPYLSENYAHFQYVHDYYDEVLYPFTDKVLLRYAVSKRNRWMVDKADLVVAYIDHNWGGAVKTFQYARKKKKSIINLYQFGKSVTNT